MLALDREGWAVSPGSEVLGKFGYLRFSGFSTQIVPSHVPVSYSLPNEALTLALKAESLTFGALPPW